MPSPQDDYRAVMLELLFARAVRPVSLDEEERFTEEMDRYWAAMTAAQREEVESWFKDRLSLSGPATLPLLDVRVTPAARSLPRRQQ